MNQESKLFRNFRTKKIKSYIIIVLLLIGAGAAGFSGYWIKESAEPVPLEDYILSEDKLNEYVYVDVTEKPYYFAQETVDSRKYDYYIIYDHDLMYIALLDIKTFNKLNSDNSADYPVRITGLTKRTGDDLKRLTLEMFEDYDEINASTFEDYFGKYYINVTLEPGISGVLYIIASILGVIAVWRLVLMIWQSKKTGGTINKYPENEWHKICSQYENEQYQYADNKNKFVLSADYIINFTAHMDVIKYDEIVWIYQAVNSINSIPVSSYINIYTKDKKLHRSASLLTKRKSKKEELMKLIYSKNTEMLVGFDYETKKLAKERYGIKARL